MYEVYLLRCVAESNRLGWFCRPETKPFIQRTNLSPLFSFASAKVVIIIVTAKFFCNFFTFFFHISIFICTFALAKTKKRINTYAPVAKLVDALDLGSSVLRCAGSSPVRRTTNQGKTNVFPWFFAIDYLLFTHTPRRGDNRV